MKLFSIIILVIIAIILIRVILKAVRLIKRGVKKTGVTPKIKGWIGEAILNHKLKRYCKKYPYKADYVRNLMLMLPSGKTTQLDFAFIYKGTIVAIENKHYKGKTKGARYSPSWDTGFIFKHSSINAFIQNDTHIAALKRILPTSYTFVNCVYMSRGKASISGLGKSDVLANSFKSLIAQLEDKVSFNYNNETIAYAKNTLTRFKSNKDIEKQHVASLKKRYGKAGV